MPDISMCLNKLCPNAPHCYRVRAKEWIYQSWVMFEYVVSVNGVECDAYIPIYKVVEATHT